MIVRKVLPLTIPFLVLFTLLFALTVPPTPADAAATARDMTIPLVNDFERPQSPEDRRQMETAQFLVPVLARDQRVAVIVCRYQETEEPTMTSEAWSELLDVVANDYMETATNGQTTFNFVPIPGICQFAYEYNDIVDDQVVRIREIPDAIRYAEQLVPTVWLEMQRVLVFVNRDKRAVAAPQIWPHETIGGISVPLSVALVPEPAADDRDEVNDGDIAVIVHELGHELGLPDLYRYFGDGTEQEPVEFWGMMSNDNLQNFTGLSRKATGWLGSQQQTVVTPPVIGTFQQDFTIHPPTTTGGQGIELLRLDLDPIGLDLVPGGYLVEARPKIGLDATNTTSSFVSGPLPEGQFPSGRWGSFLGLPEEYEEGVLISRADDFLPAFSLAAQPLVGLPVLEVQPREFVEPADPRNQGQLARAAFRPGDTFRDDDLGLTLSVLQQNADDSFDVRVRWEGLTWPDGVATDMWLDNPVNGFGTFMMPADANGIPLLFGDPVALVGSIEWINGVPVPTVNPIDHRLFLRARNAGNATASNVSGTLYLFDPLLAASIDPMNPVNLAALATTTRQINFGNIPPGGAVNIFETIRPTGPFLAAFRLNDLPDEIVTINNAYFESFLLFFITPGSPYPPVNITLPIRNVNQDRHVILPTIAPLPESWSYRVTPPYDLLEPGEEREFNLVVYPPSSRELRPGTFPQEIRSLAWMDAEHSMIPVAELSAYVAPTHPTWLTLERLKGGTLGGRLTFRGADGVIRPVPSAPLMVVITGDNGTHITLPVITDANGNYQLPVSTQPGVRYAAVATFAGTLNNHSVQSAPLFWEDTTAPTITALRPPSVTVGSRPFWLAVAGENFTRGSVMTWDGVPRSTRVISQNEVMVYIEQENLRSTGSPELRIQDGTSNTVSAPRSFTVAPVRVGESEIDPEDGSSPPGATQSFDIHWVHPTQGWRFLHYLDLRFSLGDDVALWVRFTEGRDEEGSDASTFSLLDGEGSIIGTGRGGSDVVLESDTAILHLDRTSFVSEPSGSRHVDISVTVTLKPAVAGRLYNIEVYERDDEGTIQGPDIVGSWSIDHALFLPLALSDR
jgi:hypothetical protein